MFVIIGVYVNNAMEILRRRIVARTRRDTTCMVTVRERASSESFMNPVLSVM